MELNEKGLRERKWWTERGYKLPEFDRKAVREATGRGPKMWRISWVWRRRWRKPAV